MDLLKSAFESVVATKRMAHPFHLAQNCLTHS